MFELRRYSLAEHEKVINSAIFPASWVVCMMHAIAGKAVASNEAASLAFKAHQQQVVRYATVMD